MRILFVSEVASLHAARWVNTVQSAGLESDFFQAQPNPSALSNAFERYAGRVFLPFKVDGPSVSQVPLLFESRAEMGLSKAKGDLNLRFLSSLISVIREVKPDFVHLLGLCINYVNLSEPIVLAKRRLGREMPPIIYSSWGADLDYFPFIRKGVGPSIRRFLSQADFHISECQRDIRLAQKMGFRGTLAGIFPANGGFDSSLCSNAIGGEVVPVRNRIVVKGRDFQDGDPIGRASTIMEALRIVGSKLRGYSIHITQASGGSHIPEQARMLRKEFGIDVQIEPFLKEEALYKLLSESRLFISMTTNDGLPLSLVEAMALGAYPIHSDLESIRDYITDGENGTLTSPENPAELAAKILQVLENENALERARVHNMNITREKWLRSVIEGKLAPLYKELKRLKSPRKGWFGMRFLD